MNRKFVYNGKTYSSYDELPPEARSALDKVSEHFADKDGNGVPDLFESGIKMVQTTQVVTNQSDNNGTEDAFRFRGTVQSDGSATGHTSIQKGTGITIFWTFLATVLLMAGIIGAILYMNPEIVKSILSSQ